MRRSSARRASALAVVVAALLIGGAALAVSQRNAGSGDRSAPTDPTAAAPAEADASLPTTDPPAPEPPATDPPPPPTSPLASVAGKTIVIDPGHNGGNASHPDVINRPVDIGTQERACDTTGSSTDDGYSEYEFNLDLSLRLAEILRVAGADVVLTRTDNTGVGPCIDERAAIGNLAGADAAISIHADGGPADGRGFHLIFPPSVPGLTDDIADASRRLALELRAAYLEGTGVPYADYIGGDGLSERSDLGGTNLSDVPKVFLETGNMRNATDAALLTDPGFRQRAAEAIAVGLARYLARGADAVAPGISARPC